MNTDEQVLQVLHVRGVKFTLKNNKQLYARGNGYLATTHKMDKIRLSFDEDMLVDYCINKIVFDEEYNTDVNIGSALPTQRERCTAYGRVREANYLSVHDTQDHSYDVYVQNDFVNYSCSLLQSKTAKYFFAVSSAVGLLAAGLCYYKERRQG